ncbi:MAG: guanylate cyclase [Acidimicrobiales bacterium]|nr:guanylate cyclase [Acidimicrobiales bacterium]
MGGDRAVGTGEVGARAAAARPDDAVLGARVELSRWGLRFVTDATERAYRPWRTVESLPFTRVGMVGSLMGWAGILLAFSTIAGALDASIAWILGLMIPMLGLTLWLSYRRWAVPVMPAATAVSNATAGLLLVWFVSGHAMHDPQGAAIGTMAVATFGFIIFRLRPLTAAVTVLSYVALAIVELSLALHHGSLDHTRFTSAFLGVVLSYLWGLMVSVFLERQSRQAFRQERIIEAQTRAIAAERERSEALLRNVLPEPIAERLKSRPGVIADHFDDVTVVFADIVGFTPLSATMAPADLVAMLNRVFVAFDQLAEALGVEKIKTIGDAYMAVAGLPEPCVDHAARAAHLALAMRDAVIDRAAGTASEPAPLAFRIGLCSGPAVAGVIGTRKFAYDLWGDTVNMAARMESHGVPGQIQITASTERLLDASFACEPRGLVEVKGRGPVETWFLQGTVTPAEPLAAVD